MLITKINTKRSHCALICIITHYHYHYAYLHDPMPYVRRNDEHGWGI